MRLSGTVVVDASTVLSNSSVVVDENTIVAVGAREAIAERYPGHRERSFDIIAPGQVGGHVHSIQSLGRGMAEDCDLLDWLFDHVLPLEATLTADEMEVAAKLGYLELLESGVTTVIDHLSVHHADRAFEAAGEMGIRGLLGKAMMDQRAPEGLCEETDDALTETESLIRTYDGSFDDRIRCAVTPRFAVTCSEACLRGARDLADRYGVRIHTHASENRRERATVEADTGMSNIHWLDTVGLTGEDVILAHCVWTDESEREVLAETGTHVAHCPSTNMKLASGVAPVPEYLDRGINVALGNDGPPANNTLDPFTEMRQASTLQKVERLDATALPAETVFEMSTVNGARAAGFDRVGTLREGWRADIIGLRADVTRATPLYDVLSHLVFSARATDVVFTMVDGEVLRDADGLHVADADAIRQEAHEIADSLDLTEARENARALKPRSR